MAAWLIRSLARIRPSLPIQNARNFLSEAYLCKDAWRKRLEDPIIKKFKTNVYYYELDKKLNSEQSVGAVDIDIFANGITETDYLEDLEELIHRFRRTPVTAQAFESTSHAVIRTFLDLGDTDALMRILNDRLNYGIFHDFFTANLMMDHFVKTENYRDAAKVAVLMMLQEDFEHPISNHLALYSCHMYLRHPHPEPWEEAEEVNQEQEDEEIIMRVQYVDQPYFDDHFDLQNPNHLIGKTLSLLGKKVDNSIGLTSQLMGLALYEKWENAELLLKETAKDKKLTLLHEGLEHFKKHLQGIPDSKIKASITSLLEKLNGGNQIIEGNLLNLIQGNLGSVIKACEANDISQIQELYQQWSEKRQKILSEQMANYLRKERIQNIIEKKKKLKKKEELLFFFENLEKHRLNIPPPEEDEMINEEGMVSGKSLLEVPPEIEGKTGRFSSGIIEQHDPWWKWKETKLENPIKNILNNPNFIKPKK